MGRFDVQHTLKTRKNILLVANDDSELAGIGTSLKDLDYIVTRARNVEVAQQAIDRAHDLALILIDGRDFNEPGAELVALIKDRHRKLPVIWVGEPAAWVSPPDAKLPFPLDISALEQQAKRLLLDDLYPPSLVRCFVSSGNEVMTSTFECAVEAAEPVLNHAALCPGNVSAFMQFVGEDSFGHLIVTGYEERLAALAEQIGYDPSEGVHRMAMDIAGEIANQVVGRMKATSEFLTGIRLGLPYVITGENFSLHTPSRKPSLSLAISYSDAKLWLDFWFQTQLNQSAEAQQHNALLAEGGLLFL